ncbi:hypothetical protein DBR32_04760 [Taibaiella sp. KBW10]|uniref:hypothetical protein n=1 Tax=Taibaiella sp. KBW10 TaxID=2153357 RepID=UPI000F597489|nr:hypothetical protein [Taibaiella sp. KBW10]RQO31282.1 hypothetical protein DBR32_04760 [Taibaiella sp. KBW10]
MLYINHCVSLRNDALHVDKHLQHTLPVAEIGETLTGLYRLLEISYPKFFKMDLVSKAAFLATEVLMQAVRFEGNRDKVATVLTTASGCLAVDEKFEASRSEGASPALFVYTLPNIMLGEICIRHQFKGEQLCSVAPATDCYFMEGYVQDLLDNHDTDACLCGFVEAYDQTIDVRLIWVSAQESKTPFDQEHLLQIFAS